MVNINDLVKNELDKPQYIVKSSLFDMIEPKLIVEIQELYEMDKEALSKLPLRVVTKPKNLNPGEFAVPMKDKHKERRMNPRTGRFKKFKTTKWFTTTIPPEERTLKNLPRYADKKPKCRFQDWLMLSKTSVSHHSVGKSPNGNWYGWSHRAIGEFGIGKLIKPDTIGNKFEYSDEVEKEYAALAEKHGYEVADKWRKEKGKFEPYTIKTDEEAMQHAIRFAKDVS